MLGESGDQRATKPLIELLETDSYEGCRGSCALALGQIGGRDAVTALEASRFKKQGGHKVRVMESRARGVKRWSEREMAGTLRISALQEAVDLKKKSL